MGHRKQAAKQHITLDAPSFRWTLIAACFFFSHIESARIKLTCIKSHVIWNSMGANLWGWHRLPTVGLKKKQLQKRSNSHLQKHHLKDLLAVLVKENKLLNVWTKSCREWSYLEVKQHPIIGNIPIRDQTNHIATNWICFPKNCINFHSSGIQSFSENGNGT